MHDRKRRTTLLFLAIGLGGPAWGQTPYQVTDLDPAVSPEAVVGARAMTPTAAGLFTMAEMATGQGLVRIDAAGVPSLVRQIPPRDPDAWRVMTDDGTRVFFTAQGGLWVSDGTPGGTTMVKQQFSGNSSGGAGSEIANVNGTVYFRVNAGAGIGPELWKSDGTAAGTVRVAGVSARDLTPAGNRLFFTNLGDSLWTTDGTEAGTVQLGTVVVKEVLNMMVPQGNGILFIGSDTGLGGDLWRSDGTQAGTVKVKTFAPSTAHSLTRLGNVFLMAVAGPSTALWKTDGTEAGTTLVKDALSIRSMHEANGTVFIHGHTPATGYELWTSDGTTAGTVVVDECPGTCSTLTPSNTYFATLPGAVVFSRRPFGDLWRSDGTVAGTTFVRDITGCGDFGDPSPMTSFAGLAYFSACDTGREEEWRTDGTLAGTVRVTGGADGAASSPAFVGDAGERAIFSATRPDVGREIWSTQGSAASTQLVRDLVAGPAGSDWRPVASLGQRFTFTQVTQAAPAGPLWSTDGSPAGTQVISTLPVDDSRRAAVHDGLAIYTQGEPGTIFSHAGRTDGTAEGTFAIVPPEGTNSTVAPTKEAIAVHNGGFAIAMGENGTGVWLTIDGSDPAAPFTLPRFCRWLTSVEERLFLACQVGYLLNDELWVSDGTHSGTVLVAGLPGVHVPGWVSAEGRLYFRVADANGSRTLWSSDGTAAGTAPVPLAPTNPAGLTVSNGLLYFAGFTPEAGTELWRTDGTAAGTFLLRDLDPGPASGVSFSFETDAAIAAVEGGVVFTGTTPIRGAELWQSDGTTAGTTPLAEIAPGPASASPGSLRRVGSHVFFAADDGGQGREPWAFDLATPSVTVDDLAVTEGDAGTVTASFAVHLDFPAAGPVTLSYATAGDSALGGADFVPTSGTLSFAPGVTDLSVLVAVLGDLADETDESFALKLGSVTGAAVADGRGAAVILDDDQPRVAAGAASVVEGDTAIASASFTVTLTTGDGQPTPHAVVVNGETVPITAGLEDFPPNSGGPAATVMFPAGSPSGTTRALLVPVLGDTLDEPNESFQVRLDGQNDATTGAPPTGVILDDDGVTAAPPVELAHGSVVQGDLEPPAGPDDVDFYVLKQSLGESYELVAEAVSGNAAPLVIKRVSSDGLPLQTALPTGSGTAMSMRWFGTDTSSEHLMVRGTCAVPCGPDDVYRLRFYDTTMAASRVNNSGSQTTVLVLQNTTSAPVNARVLHWFPNGTFDPANWVTFVTIGPHGTAVVPTATLELPAFTGSITVASDAPFGGLAGKAVSFEPSTGLAFDTPLVNRSR